MLSVASAVLSMTAFIVEAACPLQQLGLQFRLSYVAVVGAAEAVRAYHDGRL